ncbi:alpha/beta fold hydrolase [Candidatus Gracilibacteria bacterium]|nr:alpha/beta fold hydrolase [Candidatus Gracilibacteria bacterium]NJP19186.1 alpha/beta fold hydrolase [Hydrococcus sp. CRU_1_1]
MTTIVEDLRVELDGLSIRYFQAGQDGFPLVLLHGTGESAIDWSWVMPSLADSYRVYAPDLPGSGDSSKPARDYSLEFYTQFTVDFLKVLGIEQAVLIGNSLGGLISLRVALYYPERVAALVLVDSSGLGLAVNPALSHLTLPWYGEIAIASVITPFGASFRARGRSLLLFANPAEVPPIWFAEQERLALMPGFLEAVLSSLRAQLTPFSQRAPMLDSLPHLQMPTLVVWGENDALLPQEQAYAAVKCLQQGYLVTIPNCGHVVPVERPKELTVALQDFLAKVFVLNGAPTND